MNNKKNKIINSQCDVKMTHHMEPNDYITKINNMYNRAIRI